MHTYPMNIPALFSTSCRTSLVHGAVNATPVVPVAVGQAVPVLPNQAKALEEKLRCWAGATTPEAAGFQNEEFLEEHYYYIDINTIWILSDFVLSDLNCHYWYGIITDISNYFS